MSETSSFFCFCCSENKPLTTSLGYMTTRNGDTICFSCVGHSEAVALVKSKGKNGALNPLNLVEFEKHQQAVVIRTNIPR